MTGITRERGHAVIELNWTHPPLSLNDRIHWRARAVIVARVRADVAWLAKAARLPTGRAHCAVTLHWRPRDNRVRDADNPVPTLKVCCDALIDHGLVPDDDPAHMTKSMPIVHRAEKGRPAAMWLDITWSDERPP